MTIPPRRRTTSRTVPVTTPPPRGSSQVTTHPSPIERVAFAGRKAKAAYAEAHRATTKNTGRKR